MLGDSAYQVVFVWLLLSASHSPAVLATVLVAAAIPRGLLLLLGGAVTDRFSPRTVMLASHLVRAAALAVLALLVHASGLRTWELATTGVLFGVADAFFVPASGSILPTLVPPGDLARANALVGVSEQATSLAGPVLGGAALAGTSPGTALALNAVTFLVAASTILTAPRRHTPRDQPGRSGTAVLTEVRDGLAYATRNAGVRVILVLVTAATLSYSGLFAVGLPTLVRSTHRGALALGILISAWFLGQLLGAAAATVTGLPERWGRLILGMTLAEGACFAVLGFEPNYLLAATLFALLGFGVAYSTDVAIPTYLQGSIPQVLLGRVNSVVNLPRYTLEPVSIAAMGALATIGVRWTFVAAAVPLLLASAIIAASRTARNLGTAPGRSPDA